MEMDSAAPGGTATPLLRAGPIEIDLVAHRVRRNGHALHLGPTEFRLLYFLAQRPDRVFSRKDLLANLWTGKSVDVRVVDVYVRRLRAALGSGLNVIRTVRGFGYAFEESENLT